MKVDPAGKPARTRWRVLSREGDRAWMEFQPETGRTHQIRVHAEALGCPIVGDVQYGAASEEPTRLHARRLTLPLYQARPPVVIEAEAPAGFLERFKTQGNG